MGIPALEDGLFANLSIYDYLYVFRFFCKGKGREGKGKGKGKGKKKGKGREKGLPILLKRMSMGELSNEHGDTI